MSAAAMTAAAVETSTAAAMEAAAVAATSASIATAISAAITTASIRIATTIAIPASISVAIASAVDATIAISIAAAIVAIAAPQPRASPDKESAAKPRRAIVAVRSTGIRRIPIISVRTNRRTVAIAATIGIRAYADTNRDLSVRIRHRDKEDRKQSNIS
jgi:hypothetical protein